MSWPMVKLKDCCQVVGGATPKRNIASYWDGDIPWITPKDVSNLDEPYIYEAPEYISSAGYKAAATYMLPAGTVLLTSRAPIGNVAIAGIDLCTNQGFKSLIPGRYVYNKYLYHCIKRFVPQLELLGNGATFKEVSKKVVENFEIPLPPFEEQKRIADILDKADGIRQKREQAIKLAHDFLQTTFEKKFNNQTFLLNGWELKELKDIAFIQTGPFGTQLHKEDYVENGIPLINPTNIKNGIIIPNFKLCVDRQKYDRLKEYHLKKGDIIMGRRGEMGRCALINDKEDGWFCGTGSLFIRLKTPNEIFSFYLNEYLSSDSIKNFLQKESRGVTMANLNKDIVGKIKINIPPTNVLTSFMKIKLKVDSIKKKINHSDLDELMSSLSKKYFQI